MRCDNVCQTIDKRGIIVGCAAARNSFRSNLCMNFNLLYMSCHNQYCGGTASFDTAGFGFGFSKRMRFSAVPVPKPQNCSTPETNKLN
jgi:hypothetical protein